FTSLFASLSLSFTRRTVEGPYFQSICNISSSDLVGSIKGDNSFFLVMTQRYETFPRLEKYFYHRSLNILFQLFLEKITNSAFPTIQNSGIGPQVLESTE